MTLKQERLRAEGAYHEAAEEKPVPVLLDGYCDRWLRLQQTKVKESTLVKYTTIVNKHIKPFLGQIPVMQLSAICIEQFGYHLLYDKQLSPKTVKDILMVLHGVCRYVDKRYPAQLPPFDMPYPKVVRREMRVLTAEEQRRLVGYLLNQIDGCKLGVLIALMTGIRIGELCALRWRDISLEQKTVKIKTTMQRLKNLNQTGAEKTRVVISEPKSDRAVREIPLMQPLFALCRQYYPADAEAFLLTGRADRYTEPRTMQYRLAEYAAACHLSDIHFHTLRHTFATRCVESDFEIKSLSEILGHATPRITLERYVHSSMELKRSNMNKLAVIGF